MQILVQALTQDVRIIQIMFGPENAVEKSCLLCCQYCEVQVSRQSVALPSSQKSQQCFRKMLKKKKKR